MNRRELFSKFRDVLVMFGVAGVIPQIPVSANQKIIERCPGNILYAVKPGDEMHSHWTVDFVLTIHQLKVNDWFKSTMANYREEYPTSKILNSIVESTREFYRTELAELLSRSVLFNLCDVTIDYDTVGPMHLRIVYNFPSIERVIVFTYPILGVDW